jgi:hypothetical protein
MCQILGIKNKWNSMTMKSPQNLISGRCLQEIYSDIQNEEVWIESFNFWNRTKNKISLTSMLRKRSLKHYKTTHQNTGYQKSSILIESLTHQASHLLPSGLTVYVLTNLTSNHSLRGRVLSAAHRKHYWIKILMI